MRGRTRIEKFRNLTGGELGTGGGRKFRVRKINFHHKLQEDDCQQSANKRNCDDCKSNT